jgi:hypothetical protein
MQSALHLKPVTGACMGPVGKVANSYDQRDGEHGRPAAAGTVAFIGMMARLTIAQATRQVWIVLRDMAVTEMLKQRPMSADTLPQLEGDGRARAGAGFFIFFLWVTTCHPSRSHREGGARRPPP